MTERQEIGHCSLVVQRRVIQDLASQLPGTAYEVRIGDDKPETDAGRQCLRQAGDIDNTTFVVHAAQRGQRMVHVVGFTLVIVFDNQEVVFHGRTNQLLTTVQWH